MFVEICKTTFKLLKKNFIFLTFFFIINIFIFRLSDTIFKYQLNESFLFQIKILFKLLENLLLIILIMVLSKSMGYSVNYIKSVRYLIFYTLLDLLVIIIPKSLFFVIILKMFLLFFPYLYFIENLNVNSSIKFSITLFKELYVYIVLQFITYFIILSFLVSIFLRDIDRNINVGDAIKILEPKLPYLASVIFLVKTLFIAGLYFGFKIKTDNKNKNEDE